MIENIRKYEGEIKEIWERERKEKRAKDIFPSLGKYFDVSLIHGNPDWVFFISLIAKWTKKERRERKEKEGEEINKEVGEITDEQIEEIQNQNRKKTILLLKKALDDYTENPERMKRIEVKTLISFYKTIQAMEESKKRTEIAKGKLKLGAVRTLLPYLRMKPEELDALKEKINDSFGRIRQFRETGDSEQSSAGAG